MRLGGPHPFPVLHTPKAEEFYVCIYATREGDYVLFHHEGGVDVGDVDAKAQKLLVGVDEKLNPEDIRRHLLVHAPEDKKELSARGCGGKAKGLLAQSREHGWGDLLCGWESGLGAAWAYMSPHLCAPVCLAAGRSFLP